jgi:hypothetical protein
LVAGNPQGSFDYHAGFDDSKPNNWGAGEVDQVICHAGRPGVTAAKLTTLFADLHKPTRRSITFNNGSGCAHQEKLEREPGLISFFYGPHSA